MPAQDDTYVITARSRFVGRMMPDPQFATAPPRRQRILQQLWVKPNGPGEEWRDVPYVEETA